MGFSEKQTRALARGVPERRLRLRVRDGKELPYVEGWFAVAEANRIFGFDGWDRETLETKCVLGREARGSFQAVYTAKVRVTVRAGDRVIVREGHGSGEGRGGQAGEVHDVALKAAETDATKRALATFGRAFGLALYSNGATGRERKPGNGQRPANIEATDGTDNRMPLRVTTEGSPERDERPNPTDSSNRVLIEPSALAIEPNPSTENHAPISGPRCSNRYRQERPDAW